MTHVFLVQHSYEIAETDEIKLIGIFSAEDLARKAIDDLKGQRGFKDFPEEAWTLGPLRELLSMLIEMFTRRSALRVTEYFSGEIVMD